VTLNAVIFIDANQYLELYRIVSGKKLLPAVQEQKDNILVTAQVVDEVNRNKVRVAASLLAEEIKKLELSGVAVPAHLLSDEKGRVKLMSNQLENTRKQVKDTREEFKKLTHDVLEQVSQSKDEMSKGLAELFDRAVSPTEDELNRAWKRKEHGNPPGKRDDPLGDELSWEQILSRCKDKPKLWIITKDSDYGTVHADIMFLNAALHQDLALLYRSEPEVFCFDNIDDGLRHFASTTGAKAEKLPTPEEAEEIKKEQEALPPPGWLTSFDDSGQITVRLQDSFRTRDAARLMAAWGAQGNSEVVIVPPGANGPNKDSRD
jgi:hypothetical protein